LNTINAQELLSLSPKYLLIVDLDATCCDAGTIERQESEIIEIGAILVRLNNKREVGLFNKFIKPVRHPKLTPFCSKLTRITQADVNNTKRFKDVMVALEQWLRPYDGNYLMCSWGNYDRNHIILDCKYFGVNNPIASNHLNLKAALLLWRSI
jgi:inhibitor of KinA sporulation pathway (predicted exonuclease)